MINEIKQDAEARMKKTLEALGQSLAKIRTGRAHPSLLEGVMVSYYGNLTPLSQVGNIGVEDARTLTVNVWEKHLVPDVEKAIMKSDLGLNPVTAGEVIRIPLPMLTEETRKGYIKQAKKAAENSRVSIRNIRRDANGNVKELLKDKEISEDDERRAEDEIQKITDGFISQIEKALEVKEVDLMKV